MLILMGASATGKSEIAKVLVSKYGMHKFVTCTTREKRIGEIDKRDYYFLSIDEFKEKINNDEFIEWTIYNNNYYGSLKKELSNNKVLIVEPNGFSKFKDLKNVYSVYLNFDEKIRYQRMLQRQDDVMKANERIERDRLVFNDELRNECDLVIDNSNLSVLELADYIYKHYKEEF